MCGYKTHFNMPRRKHITITPQQARQLNEIGGQHGRGMFPGAFDPDDWADMTSMIDVPVYIAKGRGKYAGEGGRWTTLLKEMFQKAAKNPEVRKLAKAAAGKALKKGSAGVPGVPGVCTPPVISPLKRTRTFRVGAKGRHVAPPSWKTIAPP